MAINLTISDNRESVPLITDNGNPYYVGARAYVTQTENGAVVTVIDKDGTTVATINNGEQGIQGETGNGIASAILNADYTLTLLFTDGTSVTTASIRGEQGVQGIQGIQGEKGDKGDKGDTGDVSIAQLQSAVVKGTASGSIATFTDGAENIPVVDLVADIEPIQSGSGTASPDNVRPISGHDSVIVTRTGKNLIPKATSASHNGLTFTVEDDGSITVDGTATGTSILSLPSITLLSGTYTLSGCPSGGGVNTYRIDLRENGNVVYTPDNGAGATFSPTDTVTLAPTIRFSSGYAANNIQFYPMIEIGSSKTDYEPYKRDTYTTSLGRTVYKGTLDVTSGLLTVTQTAIDMGTLSWTYNATSQIHTAIMPTDAIELINVGDRGAICSAYDRGDYPNDFANGKFVVCDSNLSSSAKRIGVKNTAITDATAFAESVTGQTLVYTLAEPQTYQLTAQQVTTLLGTNNIWANSGAVEVTYCADSEDVFGRKYTFPTGGIPKTDLASSVQTSLGKADTALQSYTETDPTVPSWAKASSKPTYTASEVGAVPTTRTVNGKALSSNITLTAADVSALPSSTVIPTYTAGTGIDITNGVISIDLDSAEGSDY